MIDRAKFTGVPRSTLLVLMLSVFTVSMGYGIVLPLLPNVIERLLGAAGGALNNNWWRGGRPPLRNCGDFTFAVIANTGL